MSTNRIEKEILLKAPPGASVARTVRFRRVRARFGRRFNGPFTPGARMRGAISSLFLCPSPTLDETIVAIGR
jgi:hypothetical protein